MVDVHAQAASAAGDEAAGDGIGQGVQLAEGRVAEQPTTPALAPAPGVGGPGEGAAGPSGGIGPGGAASRAIARSRDRRDGMNDRPWLIAFRNYLFVVAFLCTPRAVASSGRHASRIVPTRSALSLSA